MNLFSVTYEIITPKSAELGEAESQGYISENVHLRDAIADLGSSRHETESDSWPCRDPRWITRYCINANNHNENHDENRSLHIPRTVTAATARRIARLLGVKVS